jgi:hypothetical protein
MNAIVLIDCLAIYLCAVTGPAVSRWWTLTLFEALARSLHAGFCSTETYRDRMIKPRCTLDTHSIFAMRMTTVRELKRTVGCMTKAHLNDRLAGLEKKR